MSSVTDPTTSNPSVRRQPPLLPHLANFVVSAGPERFTQPFTGWRTSMAHRPVSASGRRALCKGEQLLMNLTPIYEPLDAEMFEQSMMSFATPGGSLEEAVATFDQIVEAAIKRGGIGVLGQKPEPDDTDFYSVPVPHSDFVIRIWDGGVGMFRQFCFDLFDKHLRTPVNLPPNWEFWPSEANVPGVFFGAGPIHSWEVSAGVDRSDMKPGAEKWCAPEGSNVSLHRKDMPGDGFTFAIPTRTPTQAIAQPQYGVRM